MTSSIRKRHNRSWQLPAFMVSLAAVFSLTMFVLFSSMANEFEHSDAIYSPQPASTSADGLMAQGCMVENVWISQGELMNCAQVVHKETGTPFSIGEDEEPVVESTIEP